MGRYEATIEETIKQVPVYVVKDSITKEWLHVYDCFLWAKHKAEELNRKFSPCNTCAFSECSDEYFVCQECGARKYEQSN